MADSEDSAKKHCVWLVLSVSLDIWQCLPCEHNSSFNSCSAWFSQMKPPISRDGQEAVAWEDVKKPGSSTFWTESERTYWGDVSYSILPLGVVHSANYRLTTWSRQFSSLWNSSFWVLTPGQCIPIGVIDFNSLICLLVLFLILVC